MRFKILCVLTATALGAFGVAGARETGPYDRPKDRATLGTSAQIDPQKAYVDTRWIGLRSKAMNDCPPVPGWEFERSLDQVLARLTQEQRKKDSYENPLTAHYQQQYPRQQLAPADQALFHRLGLDRFCIYTPKTSPPQEFIPPPGLAVARDRMALSGSAGEATDLEARVWKILNRHFFQQSGQLETFAIPGKLRIRLAFLDSQPDGDFPPRRLLGSDHGYTLAHLAHQLICPDPGTCAVDIKTRRALNYDHFRPGEALEPLPDTKSGNIGTVDDLADAIQQEVLSWQPTASSPHLILNLSLGWDGEIFSNLKKVHDLDARSVADLEPSVQRVYQALRLAEEKGVLVIAAAGNRRGGPMHSSWPLLPAAWEMRRPSWSPLFHRGRMVYAVGGVDWQGLPLPNSRAKGGLPPRVAYGDHAVADRGDHEPTGIYTGSSISAAVVSSIAAAVWRLRPELRPDQVMRLIDRSGDPLESQADFYAWRTFWPLSVLKPAPQLSRVSLCAAVKLACLSDQAGCHTSTPPACSWYRQPPPLQNQFPPTPQGPSFVPEALSSQFTSICGESTRFFRPETNTEFLATPCPTEQYSGVASQRWVFPQPDAVPCPGCTLGPPTREIAAVTQPSPPESSTLQFQLSPDWREEKLAPQGIALTGEATLDLDCFVNGQAQPRLTYQVQFDPASNDRQPIVGIGEGLSLWGCSTQLNFVLRKTGGSGMVSSIQNPVVDVPF